MNLLLRAIIGAYLLYLAYQLRVDFSSPPLTAAMVIFAVAGAVIAANSLKRLICKEYDIPGQTDDEQEQKSD